jgi:hypothetical protein
VKRATKGKQGSVYLPYNLVDMVEKMEQAGGFGSQNATLIFLIEKGLESEINKPTHSSQIEIVNVTAHENNMLFTFSSKVALSDVVIDKIKLLDGVNLVNVITNTEFNVSVDNTKTLDLKSNINKIIVSHLINGDVFYD